MFLFFLYILDDSFPAPDWLLLLHIDIITDNELEYIELLKKLKSINLIEKL